MLSSILDPSSSFFGLMVPWACFSYSRTSLSFLESEMRAQDVHQGPSPWQYLHIHFCWPGAVAAANPHQFSSSVSLSHSFLESILPVKTWKLDHTLKRTSMQTWGFPSVWDISPYTLIPVVLCFCTLTLFLMGHKTQRGRAKLNMEYNVWALLF